MWGGRACAGRGDSQSRRAPMRFTEAWSARFTIVATVLSLGLAAWLIMPVRARGAQDVQNDWRLHNFDLHSSRYSPADEINASNVGRLTLKWSIETGGSDTIAQATPLVVDGVMYFNAGSKLMAVNAATGAAIWTYQVTPAFPG